MDDSLARLEFARVLEEVTAYASSESGGSLVSALEPGWSRECALALKRETLAAADLSGRGFRPPVDRADSLFDVCMSLQEGVIALDPVQLRSAGETMVAVEEFLGSMKSGDGPGIPEGLEKYIRVMTGIPGFGKRLLTLISPDGEVSPSASKKMSELYRKVARLEDRLARKVESIRSRLDRGGLLRDIPPTIRNGRYVLPVKASLKRRVGGIVHDRSESGETVFIEPSELVEDGNALVEASLALESEKRRILREETGRLRSALPALEMTARALAELDAVFARAAFHLQRKTVFPGEGALFLEELGHPLISPPEMKTNTITLPEDWNILVVSGPNAGGKSVLLKSVGLAVACSQAGLGCLASAGSTLPHFTRMFVSMGDQQSIDEHRSTYSARLMEQLRMLEEADGESIALIDEPSAGTDPMAGTALAVAVLENLADSGCRVMVTTHQGGLKNLGGGRPGFYDGSMGFEKETLKPDFRYVPGVPGSSFTLEIAKRIGFPGSVLTRAEELAGDYFRLEGILEEVTALRSRLKNTLAEYRRRVKDDEKMLTAEMEELREEREKLEHRRKEMDHRLRSLVEGINSRADSLLGKLALAADRDERRKLREEIRKIDVPVRLSHGSGSDEEADGIRLEPGDWVEVKGWGGRGRVEEVGEEHVVVLMGNLRLRKKKSEVSRSEVPETKSSSAEWNGSADVSPEIDLRGTFAEEALALLDAALDNGIAVGLPYVRVIHGKGKGILMRAVVDMARKDPRVKSFRSGRPFEGGTGVTIIYLEQPGEEDG